MTAGRRRRREEEQIIDLMAGWGPSVGSGNAVCVVWSGACRVCGVMMEISHSLKNKPADLFVSGPLNQFSTHGRGGNERVFIHLQHHRPSAALSGVRVSERVPPMFSVCAPSIQQQYWPT